jgi:hypothetical protein
VGADVAALVHGVLSRMRHRVPIGRCRIISPPPFAVLRPSNRGLRKVHDHVRVAVCRLRRSLLQGSTVVHDKVTIVLGSTRRLGCGLFSWLVRGSSTASALAFLSTVTTDKASPVVGPRHDWSQAGT